MGKMLAAMSFAAGIVAISCQGAGALPAAAIAVKAAATAASPLQRAQFRGYRTRHHVVKCYRDLVIGPYRCHYYRRHWW